MESQAEKCALCNNYPGTSTIDKLKDDILMLACNHDLCLNCAAKVFHES
jgi:hypothetical protein